MALPFKIPLFPITIDELELTAPFISPSKCNMEAKAKVPSIFAPSEITVVFETVAIGPLLKIAMVLYPPFLKNR